MSNVWRKTVISLVIGLFIGTSFIPSISGYIEEKQNTEIIDFIDFVSLPPDQLDQQQVLTDGDASVGYSLWLAQSFTPNLETLTKIELHCGIADYSDPKYFVCSIKDDLYGEDIVSLARRDDMPLNNDWYEFDFPDISVNPGEKYYIICRTDRESQQYACGWSGNSFNDAYTMGKAYKSIPFDEDWEESSWLFDMAFKTYGYADEIAEIQIGTITGGFGISSTVGNIGTVSAYDIDWSIDLDGGIILKGSHTEGTIDELAADDSTSVNVDSLFGIGPTMITVTAGEASKSATSFILGPLALRVQEH